MASMIGMSMRRHACRVAGDITSRAGPKQSWTISTSSSSASSRTGDSSRDMRSISSKRKRAPLGVSASMTISSASAGHREHGFVTSSGLHVPRATTHRTRVSLKHSMRPSSSSLFGWTFHAVIAASARATCASAHEMCLTPTLTDSSGFLLKESAKTSGGTSMTLGGLRAEA